jgi:hypothetical protein
MFGQIAIPLIRGESSANFVKKISATRLRTRDQNDSAKSTVNFESG